MDLYFDMPLSAADYNSMTTLDIVEPLSPIELEELGRIFVNHNVHHYLGATLVHRHFVLPPNHVMLRSSWTCRPTRHSAATTAASSASSSTYGAAWTLELDSGPAGDEWIFRPYELASSIGGAGG